AHRDRCVLAVVRATKIEVVFQAAVEREHLGRSPPLIARGCPGIEVLGQAAQKDLAVDGARSAGDFAARYKHGLCLGRGSASELPVVVAGQDVGGGDVSAFELVRQAL